MKNFNGFNLIRKVRKQKHCIACGRKIESGESCQNYVGVFNGDFQNWYTCTTCYEVFDIITEDGEYLDGSEMYDYISEKVGKCPICNWCYNEVDADTKNNKLVLECCENTREFDLIKFIKEQKQ